MLLYLHRRMEAAERALTEAVSLEPRNPQFLLGLVLFYREQHRPQQAIPWAEKLVGLRPDDTMYRQVLDEVRQAAAAPR
jgi:cytochrome c-type biogenesis protein CcmH/NrfG